MLVRFQVLLLAFIILSCPFSSQAADKDFSTWSEEEIKKLKSLWIENLPPLPDDPSNSYSNNPKAIDLGMKIFFDTRFSANNKVSCSSCHLPDYSFTDKLPLAKGMGTTDRRSMPFIGLAYSTYFFWDGRKDSLWSQALGPPESLAEHGISRTICATLIYNNYRADYEAVFGKMPLIDETSCPTRAIPDPENKEGFKTWQSMSEKNRQEVNLIFVNMGKAIAAYVGRIVPTTSRFDRYVKSLLTNNESRMEILSKDEIEGLRLFIGKAKCANCHRGPLFTNNFFHNIGVSEQNKANYDRGRALGIQAMQTDEFNCKSHYSDAKPDECKALNFVPIEMKETADKIEGSFKTPPLRNVSAHPPYMHDGSVATLKDVMIFYKDISPQVKKVGLNQKELDQLEAFMLTLDSPLKVLPY